MNTPDLEEHEGMQILLPPAADVSGEYLNGWCEGQAYLIANYGTDEAFDRAADVAALIAKAREVEGLRSVLSGLSSYLGAGLGDEATTPEQFDQRIRWGIEHQASAYRDRAASIVEECSKRPGTTWGEVKSAIQNDTFFPEPDNSEVEGLRAEVDRLQKQVVALCVAKQRLERACIKAAAPDFLTEAEREALHDFVKFLKSTEGTEDRAALEGKGG